MISTRDLAGLPDLPDCRFLARSLAMLDAVLSPECESRYHSFDSARDGGEARVSMRNGQVDGWLAPFADGGPGLLRAGRSTRRGACGLPASAAHTGAGATTEWVA